MSFSPPDRSASKRVKVWFRFVPREGWLPQDTEGLWATVLGEDTARIENVPFLQDGVAEGDVVRFRSDADGRLWASGRIEASGNCTVRVIPIPDGPMSRPQQVHERLAPFGLGGEVFSPELPLMALNVPASADFARIKALLDQGQADGWWHFEMGCATESWRRA